MIRTVLALALVTVCLCPNGPLRAADAASPAAVAPTTPVPAAAAPAAPAVKLSVADILKSAESLPEYEPVWTIAAAAAQAAGTDTSAIGAAAGSKNPSVVLACGYALLKTGDQQQGTEILLRLAEDPASPLARKREAISALGIEGGSYAADRLHTILTDKKSTEILQVEYAKALWRLTRSGVARGALQRLAESPSPAVREEAALALATFTSYADLQALLKDLVFQPGPTGDRARRTLETRAREALRDGEFERIAPALRAVAEHPTLDLGMSAALLEARGSVTYKTVKNPDTGLYSVGTSDAQIITLLTELIGMSRDHYPLDTTGTPEELERNKQMLSGTGLANTSAKAFVSAIDAFSAYLDEEDLTNMKSAIEGEYGGIGAWVGFRDKRFTIITPMYGAPASKAGLQSMDWVEEIDGVQIKNKNQNEIINMLKGAPNSKVKLLVWRKGWQQGREYSVTRELIHIDSVKGRMLPGNIGYIRLISFSRDTADELEKMLRSLEKEGMQALVLDLSDNPGGLLEAAVDVSSKFLGANKLIVYSEGKPTYYPRSDRLTTTDSTHPSLPMVVLVNSGSASASEIVAGAMQDHKRARLIGETTYGKGSVQQLFPVRSTNGRTQVKLTVAYYYLPSGRCIHNKGITPDVEEPLPIISFEQIDARLKLRDTQKPMEYVRRHIGEFQGLFIELLDDDFEDPARYPDFDAFREEVASAGLTLDPQDIRRELRFAIQRYFESEKGTDFIVDIEDNVPLQRAIVELGTQIKTGLPKVRLYEEFRKRFDEREAQRKKLEVAKGDFPKKDDANKEATK